MSSFGKESEVEFVALIGDIVASRSSVDRAKLQKCLLAEVERLNHRYAPAMASPLAVTSGDEIQGLFRRPAAVVDVVVGLAEAIAPDRLIYGLGYGQVDTDIGNQVALIDGPCFHRARQALQEMPPEGWLTALGLGETEDELVSSLFTLMHAVRGRWTEKQLIYVKTARRMAQKEVAEKYGVSPSTVSESLKAASFAAIRDGERAVWNLLSKFGSDTEFSDNTG